MNEVIRQLYARKSIRAYTDQEIDKEEKDAILRAAAEAPTAGNQQLYTILDITDQALKEKLVETCDHQPMIAQAKMVLIFSDPNLHAGFYRLHVCLFHIANGLIIFGYRSNSQSRIQAAEHTPNTDTRQQQNHSAHNHPDTGIRYSDIIVKLFRIGDPVKARFSKYTTCHNASSKTQGRQFLYNRISISPTDDKRLTISPFCQPFVGIK